jgi:hypothetical protein
VAAKEAETCLRGFAFVRDLGDAVGGLKRA